MRQTLDSGDYPHFFLVEKGHTLEIMILPDHVLCYIPRILEFSENKSVILENVKIYLVFYENWKTYMSYFPKIWKNTSYIFQRKRQNLMVGGVYRHETKYPISHLCDLSPTQVPACVFWFRHVLGSRDFVTIILCQTFAKIILSVKKSDFSSHLVSKKLGSFGRN